jgi:hypothetical protein
VQEEGQTINRQANQNMGQSAVKIKNKKRTSLTAASQHRNQG